jgi:hypothetical protein
MLKVKLTSNYATSERLASEVMRQFAPKNAVKKFEFTSGNDYDLLFIFNDTIEKIKDPAKTFAFAQEPSWSANYKDWTGQVAEFIAPVNNQLPMMFNWSGLDYEDAINLKAEKTKKCSFIVAKQEPREGTLYGFRNELVENILASDLDIDIYGKGWDIKDARYKGELKEKKDGLIDYHTSICIENSIEDYYVTEKFWDIVICDAFPIPYAAIAENTMQNLEAIISLASMGDSKKLVEEQKEYYFSELNIFNFIQSKCQSA